MIKVIKIYLNALLRLLVRLPVLLLCRCLFRITLTGLEHFPRQQRLPMILVCNHFSWFDAPLLTALLPRAPMFVTAVENLRNPFIRTLVELFDGIPVRRGHVDRVALQTVIQHIGRGNLVAIFPEGGIQPALAPQIARGEQVTRYMGHLSRHPPQLMPPRAGAAYVAVQSGAQILPVALLGTDTIVASLLALRRAKIIIAIGPAFGPFTLDASLKGRAKRNRLNQVSHGIMAKIAALLPPEVRGPYT